MTPPTGSQPENAAELDFVVPPECLVSPAVGPLPGIYVPAVAGPSVGRVLADVFGVRLVLARLRRQTTYNRPVDLIRRGSEAG